MKIFEAIEQLDRDLFLLLNDFHNSFFDTIMWYVSDKYIWIPFYLFLLSLVVWKYKKQSIPIIITIILLIVCTDQISGFLKETIGRFRPSYNIEIKDLVHNVNGYTGGQFSFVSSHAANSFGLAVFIGLIMKKYYKNLLSILLIWAALVSYSRIYLGVHYPLDIFCGGLLGAALGVIFFNVDKFIFSKNFNHTKNASK